MGNQYYDTRSEGYGVVQSQFQDAMAREGTSINDYWNPTATYPCIFRRNKDANKSTDHATIFYPVDAGVRAGQLLSFRGQVYLTLNQETAENGTYYRSDLIKTNTDIFTFSNNMEIRIPAVAEDLTDVAPEGGAAISTVGGAVQLLTEDCDISRAIDIDAGFAAMGGYWEVTDNNYRDGIARIYAQRTLKEAAPVYTLSIIGDTEHNVGGSTALTAIAQRDRKGVSNPTIQWNSSDISIATVSTNGIVTSSSVGEVIITATWTEHDVSASITINVREEGTQLRCEISGRSDLRVGFTRTYIAAFYDADGNTVDSIEPVWNLDVPSEFAAYIRIVSSNGLIATLEADGAAIGIVFNLLLTDADGVYYTSKSIDVVDMY